MGKEAYFIDLVMEHFENKVIAPDDRDFNLNVFYGNDADMDTVIACAQQFPVMASRKLVILKEAQSARDAKSMLDKLAPYVLHPSTTSTLVIAFKGDELNASSKLLKAAAKSDCVVMSSPELRDWQLPSQIKDYCNARKVSIDESCVNLLAEYIGLPLSKLFGELSKLIQIKGGNGCTITAQDIEKNIGISKDYNSFALADAIAEKDYVRAIKIINYFERNPKSNPTAPVTGSLLNLFSRIIMAQYAQDKSDNGLNAELGLKNNRSALKNIKTALRNYTLRQSVNALHTLREFDVKSKGVGSFQNEYALMRDMIFKIFTA